MTSSNTFKRFVSIGAALLLAVGGSLVAAEPASATPLTVTITSTYEPSNGQTTRVGSSLYNRGADTFIPSFSGQGLTFSVVWFACDTAKSSISVDTTDGTTPSGTFRTNCQVISVGATTNTTYVVDQAYLGKYIGAWTKATDSSSNWAAFYSATTTAVQAALPTATTSASISGTANTVGTNITATDTVWSSGSGAGKWYVCTLSGPPASFAPDCSALQVGLSDTTPITTTAFAIPSIVYCAQNCPLGVSSNGKYLRWGSTNQGVTDFSGTYGMSSGGGGGGGMGTCAGQTGVTAYAASSATLAPGGSYTVAYNGDPTFSNCVLPTQGVATGRYLNGVLIGSFYYSAISSGIMPSSFAYTFTSLQTQAGRNLVNGDVITGKIWVAPGNVSPSQSGPGDFSYSVTITGVTDAGLSVAPLTAEQARNSLKPLPANVQPFVSALPMLNKPMINQGGKLALTAGDFSGLVSASISGKAIDLTVASTGGLTITVPNGEAGKTADLFLKFTTGTVIIQDAIKYVAPVIVANVPVRPISIVAGSTKLSDATADEVRQAAFANMSNTSVSCVAYAANGSAAAKAAALATAQQVCDLATKANPSLTAAPVTVIVNKAKAKTAAVGIKVYKATN